MKAIQCLFTALLLCCIGGFSVAQNTYSWYGKLNLGTESSPNWLILPMGTIYDFSCATCIPHSGDGTFYVTDADESMWGVLDALDGGGANREFRFTFGDGYGYSMVFGGYTGNIIKRSKKLTIPASHYMNLLSREKSLDDNYQTKSGTYVLTGTTNPTGTTPSTSGGLIPKYFSGTQQVNISIANYVNRSSQETFTYNADSKNMLMACQDIAKRSRLSGGTVPFTFYVNYDSTTDKKQMYFDVMNNRPSGVILNHRIDFEDYRLDFDVDNIVNYWIVRGEDKTRCPIDGDWWTDKDNTTDLSLIWHKLNGSETLYASGTSVVGDYSARCSMPTISSASSYGMYLDLTSGDAYDSTLTPSDLFTNGSGYPVNRSLEQHVSFDVRINPSLQEELDGGTAAEMEFYLVGDGTNTTEVMLFQNTVDYGTVGKAGPLYNQGEAYVWYHIDMKITDIISASTVMIQGLAVQVNYGDTGSSGDIFYVDGVHFYDTRPVASDAQSDSSSISVYGRRKDVYDDRTIGPIYDGEDIIDANVKAMCNTIGSRLLAYTKNPRGQFQASLSRFYDINPMDTFTLNIPEAAVTSQTYRVNQCTYSPRGMGVVAMPSDYYDDSSLNINAYLTKIKSEIVEAARR